MNMSQLWLTSKAIAWVFSSKISEIEIHFFECKLKSDDDEPSLAKK